MHVRGTVTILHNNFAIPTASVVTLAVSYCSNQRHLTTWETRDRYDKSMLIILVIEVVGRGQPIMNLALDVEAQLKSTERKVI